MPRQGPFSSQELGARIVTVLGDGRPRTRNRLRAEVVWNAVEGSNRKSFYQAFESAADELMRRGTIALDADGKILAQPATAPRPSEPDGQAPLENVNDSARNPVTREAVLEAIDVFDRDGRDETLAAHGFRRALDYVVVHDDDEYDAKALYAIAHGILYPSPRPVRERGLSAGAAVRRKLEALGFRVKRLQAPLDDAVARPDAKVWVVHAGRDGEYEDLARDESVALLTRSELGKLGERTTIARVLRRLATTGEVPAEAAGALGELLYRFIHDLSDGDVVVLPLRRDPGKASIGIIDGPPRYLIDGPSERYDVPLQRPIEWISWAVPYESFDHDLQTAFDSSTTLSEVHGSRSADRVLAGTRGSGERTGRTPRAWWVSDRAGADQRLLWAPKVARDGSTRSDWRALEETEPGDVVLHHAGDRVEAVSAIVGTASFATREIDGVEQAGSSVAIERQPLEEPVGVDDIPRTWRAAERDAFTPDGDVLDAYLLPLSDRFVNQLAERFPQLGLKPSSSDDTAPDTLISYVEPSLAQIAVRIRGSGLRVEPRTLRRYHVSLRTRGFVVLAGVSGGGKTWLAEEYAAAVDARLLVVAVAPNWTTNEDLLGYFNPIDNAYRHTEFSRFLMDAAAEFSDANTTGRISRPFHVVLDEMNLARTEHYFARLLSAMETRSRRGTCPIVLAPQVEALLTPNLKIVGTVNVDETTFGFADKVYDRAQILELDASRHGLQEHMGDLPHREAVLTIWDAVAPVAPFAYRVVDEIGAYVLAAAHAGAPWQEALDEQLLQKVLPKIKGTDPQIRGVLEKVIAVTGTEFPLAHDKASNMLDAFTAHGIASYF